MTWLFAALWKLPASNLSMRMAADRAYVYVNARGRRPNLRPPARCHGDRLLLDDALAQCLDQRIRSPKTSRPASTVHRQKGNPGSTRTPLPTGLDAPTGAARARLPRGGHYVGRLVHRIPYRLQLDGPADLQRPRPAGPCAGRDAAPRGVLPRPALALHLGLGPIFPAWRATRSIWRSTSRLGPDRRSRKVGPPSTKPRSGRRLGNDHRNMQRHDGAPTIIAARCSDRRQSRRAS
jgi:hypothetical protein